MLASINLGPFIIKIMNQEVNKKKLRLTANTFDVHTEPLPTTSKLYSNVSLTQQNPISNYNTQQLIQQNQYIQSNLNSQYYQQQQYNVDSVNAAIYTNQYQQDQPQIKKKKKKTKPIVDEESRKQYVVSKKDDQFKSVNMASVIMKSKNQIVKKQKSSSEDEELKFDPKFGYWIYPHDEYLRLVQKKKDKDIRNKEKQIQAQVLQEQVQKQQESTRQKERVKMIEKRRKKRDLLGLARIGKIIFELRQSRGVLSQKSTKKQYKFQVDVEGEVNIVEKIKKKKLSKIKISKQSYLEDFNNNLETFNVSLQPTLITTEDIEDEYETIAELTENETHEIVKEQKIIKKDSQVVEESDKEQTDEEEEEKHECDSQVTIAKKETLQLAQVCNNLQSNPICQVPYNMMKVRGWVYHMICKELDDTILHFINNLALMQAKKKVLEPKKFKKRIVAGFNEVRRTLTTSIQEKTAKIILFPINILENPLPDGSDQKVIELIRMCQEKKIPYISGANRSKFNRAFCGKFGSKISAISVLNYQGQEELFNTLMNLVSGLQQEYDNQYKFDVFRQFNL